MYWFRMYGEPERKLFKIHGCLAEKKCSRSHCPSQKCQSERVCLLFATSRTGPKFIQIPFSNKTVQRRNNRTPTLDFDIQYTTQGKTALWRLHPISIHFRDHLSLSSVGSGTMADVCGACESCGSGSPCLLALPWPWVRCWSQWNLWISPRWDEITKLAE